ncbi:MAG: HIT family protein [Bacteroidetes bacterium]|nr:HIT family protein [Bacteroidota bacterium]MBK9671551.1 HIT family protein [Bacteroidota bacterium]MBP6413723.1 HIT family protein [Bacteroidia bacterium]
MAGIFSKIVAREIPAHIVAEDSNFLAFLDVAPLAKGHVLVIPKKEVDYIFDLDAELYTGIFLFAQKVAKAIETVIPCRKIGIAVIGLEVPHAHVHLVPINGVGDINFTKQKLQPTANELSEIAAKIKLAYQS